MVSPIKIAIVGVGKIVYDQHVPALNANPDFKVVATVSRNNTIDGIPSFKSFAEMAASDIQIDAVSLCMPPQYRYHAARVAIEAGKDVFLEKPPGATVSEVIALRELADQIGVTLFASWHSRYAPAVAPLKKLLSEQAPTSVSVNWKEDVKYWHPGQEWVWSPGGLGVFDPGINALSIVMEILPKAISLKSADLSSRKTRMRQSLPTLCFRMKSRTSFERNSTGGKRASKPGTSYCSPANTISD